MCLSIKVHHPEHVLSEGEHVGHEFVTVHNGMGHRCGYVRVPLGHPWHGKEYDDVPCDVHGGPTFAQADEPCEKDGPDNAWWIGFDCAHSGDAADPALPGYRNWGTRDYETVRTQEYVENECKRLCEQAREAGGNNA